jgi:mono/diheme cytochrome c family protein
VHFAGAAVLAVALVSSAAAALSGCAQESPAWERGARVYASNCVACHGQDGEGGLGPELTGELHHKNHQQTVAWIKHALPPMPRLYPFPLSDQDVDDVAAFVTSL